MSTSLLFVIVSAPPPPEIPVAFASAVVPLSNGDTSGAAGSAGDSGAATARPAAAGAPAAMTALEPVSGKLTWALILSVST